MLETVTTCSSIKDLLAMICPSKVLSLLGACIKNAQKEVDYAGV